MTQCQPFVSSPHPASQRAPYVWWSGMRIFSSPYLTYVHTFVHSTLSIPIPLLLPNFTDYPFYLLTSGPTTGTFHLQLSSYQFEYASSAFHKFVPSLPMPSLHPRSINISSQSRFFHSLCLPGPKRSSIQLLSRTYREQAQNIPNWNELAFLPSNPRATRNLT